MYLPDESSSGLIPISTEYPPDTDQVDHIRIWLAAKGTLPSRNREEVNYSAERVEASGAQQAWIYRRDGGVSQLPYFNLSGEIINYGNLNLGGRKEVHHIIPAYYRKRYAPMEHDNCVHNSPLNLILISNEPHAWIHNSWKEPYRREYQEHRRRGAVSLPFNEYCELQAYFGRPMWNPSLDVYFQAIATVNSYRFLEYMVDNEEQIAQDPWFPFQLRYWKEIEVMYQQVRLCDEIKDFVERHWHYMEYQFNIYQKWSDYFFPKDPKASHKQKESAIRRRNRKNRTCNKSR